MDNFFFFLTNQLQMILLLLGGWLLEQSSLNRSDHGPHLQNAKGKIDFGWKCSVDDISFINIKMTYFLGNHPLVVYSFHICRNVFFTIYHFCLFAYMWLTDFHIVVDSFICIYQNLKSFGSFLILNCCLFPTKHEPVLVPAETSFPKAHWGVQIGLGFPLGEVIMNG